jgi:hypothetical protein
MGGSGLLLMRCDARALSDSTARAFTSPDLGSSVPSLLDLRTSLSSSIWSLRNLGLLPSFADPMVSTSAWSGTMPLACAMMGDDRRSPLAPPRCCPRREEVRGVGVSSSPTRNRHDCNMKCMDSKHVHGACRRTSIDRVKSEESARTRSDKRFAAAP